MTDIEAEHRAIVDRNARDAGWNIPDGVSVVFHAVDYVAPTFTVTGPRRSRYTAAGRGEAIRLIAAHAAPGETWSVDSSNGERLIVQAAP